MADRYRRNPYNRPYRGSDERSWRQQEQFSTGERDGYNDYEEGYGHQMSDPYRRPDQGQRQADYGAAWDRNERYRGAGQGYARREPEYSSTGEYNYGPAYYDSGTSRGYTSFTSEDQAGHDFTAPAGRGYRSYGGGAPFGAPEYGYGIASRHQYDRPEHERGFFERASDEVASWFGDEDAARRREMDHTGRGPAGYTRSDERIHEDANDHLTDDWMVDGRNITVTVENGEITLDGTVPTRDQKRRAEDCVEDISGVRHVQNNLRVQERSVWDRSDETARGEGEKTTAR